MGKDQDKPVRWKRVSITHDGPPEPPYGPKEMAEDYQAILSRFDGDEKQARVCFEAYLAGRAGFMPPKRNWKKGT
jgi:hypothetical protein